jgi:hypothetical protein
MVVLQLMFMLKLLVEKEIVHQEIQIMDVIVLEEVKGLE